MNSRTPSLQKRTLLKSKWVCPIDQPPIENGVVVVLDDTIQEVGKLSEVSTSSENLIDLGDGVLIPGLVNAHTHLEFSGLEKPLGQHGIKFTDWIRLIVGNRNAINEDATNKSQAIASGLNESFQSGVWTIGEIATAPFEISDYQTSAKLQVHLFLEQLGRDDSTFEEKHSQLDSFFTSKYSGGLFQNCVSPHAPYSVHPDLLKQICGQAKYHNQPVAMHLAETKAELQLLADRTGDFVELLKDFGVWKPETFNERCSILEYLKTLASAPRSLAVHGNYLTNLEQDFIAEHRNAMSVVYCPRTHQFFDHEPYPLEELFKRGINVAIGTDSRASNPDLDLFEELKLVACLFPETPAEQILKMGTEHGSKALGCNDRVGSISIGKRAAFGFVEGDDASPSSNSEIYDWILSANTTCRPVEF